MTLFTYGHALIIGVGGDLPGKVCRNVLEVEDHRFQGSDLAGLLSGFEPLQAQRRVTWFHCSIPPTRTNRWFPEWNVSQSLRRQATTN